MYLSHEVDHMITIQTILTIQLAHMQSAGLPSSTDGLDALQVQENSNYPVQPEYDNTHHQHLPGDPLPTQHLPILLHCYPTHLQHCNIRSTPPRKQTDTMVNEHP